LLEHAVAADTITGQINNSVRYTFVRMTPNYLPLERTGALRLPPRRPRQRSRE
jgi:hypothetical protein